MVTVEFNRKNNTFYDLIVTDIDQRKRPEEQVDIINIAGRSGDIVDRYGTYASYERDICFVNRYRDDYKKINQWLTGKGILKTSLDPGGFFYADVLDALERKYLGLYYGVTNAISVKFLVEPFFYLTCGTLPFEITGRTEIRNRGTVYAEPIIKVYGSGVGEIKLNDTIIRLSKIDDYVCLDSKNRIAYKDKLPQGRNMSGDFPIFREGQNVIEFTGGIKRLEITPYWREL